MKYNDVCAQFEDDVRALYHKWINITHGFECEATGIMFGDNSLLVAHRQLTELQKKIERIERLRETKLMRFVPSERHA